MTSTLAQRVAAEALGTAFLLATVVGSGVMAQKLAGGAVALALLGNTIPTGAILVVLILIFAPISGAHMNPAVSLAMTLRGELGRRDLGAFVVAQILGGLVGVLAAHAMFDLPLLQISSDRPHRRAAMVFGSRRHLRPGADDLWLPGERAFVRPLCRRPLHHRGLLVHRLDLLRQSRRDPGARPH